MILHSFYTLVIPLYLMRYTVTVLFTLLLRVPDNYPNYLKGHLKKTKQAW